MTADTAYTMTSQAADTGHRSMVMMKLRDIGHVKSSAKETSLYLLSVGIQAAAFSKGNVITL